MGPGGSVRSQGAVVNSVDSGAETARQKRTETTVEEDQGRVGTGKGGKD